MRRRTVVGPYRTEHWESKKNLTLQGKIFLGLDVRIGEFCVIGFSDKRKPLQRLERDEASATSLGDGVIIHPYSIVYESAKLGPRVEVDSHSRIGYKTEIGARTKVVYGAKIYDLVRIGKCCVVSGFCCDGSRIGDGTTMMGNLVHKVREPLSVDDWDRGPYPRDAPVIGDNVLVGYNATIIGAVKIGDCAKVGAGAVVTRSVAPGTTVVGVPAYVLRDSRACEGGQ